MFRSSEELGARKNNHIKKLYDNYKATFSAERNEIRFILNVTGIKVQSIGFFMS